MTELHGVLEAYWEQGWEGRVEYALHVEGMTGPFLLASGQHLTIYNDSNDVLWSGRVNLVRRNNWFDRHNLDAGIWSWGKQKGVAYADWIGWFWNKPPLKATLLIDDEVSDQIQDHAGVRVHPPFVLLIHIVVAFLLNWLFPLSFVSSKFAEKLGYMFVFAGLGFAFWGIGQFRKVHTTLDPHGSVKTLVTSGPYRFSRNPIYLGLLCTLIGLPLVLGNSWGVLLSPIFMLSMVELVIKHEEAYLERKFKDVYTSYQSRVRRWL